MAQASAQVTADQNIRISQVYTRAGEAGAAFQNDFVELFNRGQTDVDVSGWSLNISNFAGTPPNIQISSTNIRFFSSPNLIMKPGGHLLIKFGFNSGNGQPLPTPDINLSPFPISDVGGQIILLPKDKTLPFHYCPAAPDLTGTVVDYVGYGTAICYEGTVRPLRRLTRRYRVWPVVVSITTITLQTSRWRRQTHATVSAA